MNYQQTRINPLPLPSSLGGRHLPRFSLEDFAIRSMTYSALETVVVRPGPHKPKIVSSAHGSLKHLLLCYPAYADGEYGFQSVYQDLFQKLPGSTKLTIVAHASVVGDLKDAINAANVSSRTVIVEAPDYISPWFGLKTHTL